MITKQGQTVIGSAITAAFKIEDETLLIQPAIDIAEILKHCGLNISDCNRIEIEQPLIKGGIEASERLGSTLEHRMRSMKGRKIVNISTKRYTERQKAFAANELLSSDLTFKEKILGLVKIYSDQDASDLVKRSVNSFSGLVKSVVLYIYSYPNNSRESRESSKLGKIDKMVNRRICNSEIGSKLNKGDIRLLHDDLCPYTQFREENLESLRSLDIHGSWKRRILCDGKMLANRQKYAIQISDSKVEHFAGKVEKTRTAMNIWLQEIADYKNNHAIANNWNALHIINIIKTLYHKKTGKVFHGSFSSSMGRDRKLASDLKRIIAYQGKPSHDIGNYLIWAFDEKFDQVNNPSLFLNIIFRENMVHEFYHNTGKKSKGNRSW